MSTTKKLNISPKGPKLSTNFNKAFFISEKQEGKNLDYFFLQFLLYKKNLANTKLNLKTKLLDKEKVTFSNAKQKFAEQIFTQSSFSLKVSEEKLTGHFLFLAPKNSLSTTSLTRGASLSSEKKETPVPLSSKAIKFALAPGKGSSSFSPINKLKEEFSKTTNTNRLLEANSFFRSPYNGSPVLLDSHTRKPFFYYWLLPFFGFLTNINTQESLTADAGGVFKANLGQFRAEASRPSLPQNFGNQDLTSYGIYPGTNFEKKFYSEVEFAYNSGNFVNSNSLSKLSYKNLENLLILEKNNWQQNLIEFSFLPALTSQPSSDISFVKSSIFETNLTNKTNLPYKLSLFNTNQNIPKNLKSKNILFDSNSLSHHVSGSDRSERVNKLPWKSEFSFSNFNNKKLNFGRQDFVNSLTGISPNSKLTSRSRFVQKQNLNRSLNTFDLRTKKTNTITQQNLATQLLLDFQKLNLFRSSGNFYFGNESQSHFSKVFWNSNFKSAVKVKKNLNIFLNRKTNSLQNLAIKQNSYTKFVLNSLFSNFDSQNFLENQNAPSEIRAAVGSARGSQLLSSLKSGEHFSISSKNVNPQILKKSELNYLILNSLKNTLNTVNRTNSTKILSELEKNLQTINNLEASANNYISVSTKRPSQTTNQKVFGFRAQLRAAEATSETLLGPGSNLLNSNIFIKIQKPQLKTKSGENFQKPKICEANFCSAFVKPIFVNKALYPAFHNNLLKTNSKKQNLPQNLENVTQAQTTSVKLERKFENFGNFISNEFNSTESNNLTLKSQNKSYNQNINYIQSLKNQLKLNLQKQNFIAKIEKEDLILNKKGYLNKTEKLVRNFLVRNKSAYSENKQNFAAKKIKNFFSPKFGQNKKAKEAIFTFFKNQLRYSLSNIKEVSTASKIWSKAQSHPGAGESPAYGNRPVKPTKMLLKTKSSGLILKNRRFLSRKKASYIYKNLNLVSAKESFVKNSILYEKRQKIAKKRKLKKQKKENRRRKKRKRFYPRPVWIRSRLYSFLRNKTNKTSTSFYLRNSSSNQSLFFTNKVSNLAYFNKPESQVNLNISQNIFTTEQSSKKTGVFLGKPLSIFALSNYSSKNLDKDLYTISRPVLGELKRVLWKSYWLRKNLNTYITKIKKELRILQEEQRKETLFETFSFIVKYLAGFDSELLKSNTKQKFAEQIFTDQFYSVSLNSTKSSSSEFLLSKNSQRRFCSVKICSANFYSTWQSAINLAEYNRLVYERMQKMIFSIRENLSSQEEMQRHIIKQLNFAHPSFKSSTKFARGKQNSSDQNLNNENKDFWLKLGKTLTFELPQSPQSFYGHTKNNRMHWALSKTYKNFREINNNNLYFSKRKNFWSTGILREQSKANKTKKLLYNLTKNIYSGIKFVKNPNFALTKELGLPRIDYIYLSKIRKTEEKLGYFGFSSNTKKKNNFVLKRQKKKYNLLFENQSFNLSSKGFSLPIQTSNYLSFNKKVNNFSQLQKSNSFVNNLSTDLENNVHATPNNYSSSNLIKQYWWTFAENNFLTTGNLFRFSSISSITKVESQANLGVYISSFLFHFCCLISLISISQIRGIIKFGLIVLSKVTNIGTQIFNLLFSVCQVFDGKFAKLLNNFSNKTTTNSQLTNSSQNSELFYNKQKLNLKQDTILGRSKPKNNLSIKSQNSKFSLEQPNPNSELLTKILTRTRETDYKQIFKSSFQNVGLNNEKTSQLGNLFVTKPNFVAAKKIYYSVYLEYLLQKNLINSNVSKRFLKNNLSTQKNPEIFKLVKKLQLLKVVSVNSQNGYNSALFIYKVSNKVLEQILGTVTKTTAFFSRPGEFIGDWLAYLFLVEWSADLKTTIPDQIFQSYYLTINKLARLTYSASALNLVKQNNLVKQIYNTGSAEKESLILNSSNSSVTNFYNLNNFSSILFSFAFSKLLQRRISILFEDILEKFFQPDTDLLVRQKKSTIFWDIWGDYLVLVAEDSSINLSELTSLKEEQIKLLEILLTNSAIYSAQKSNNMFIANLTEKLSNFSFSQKQNSSKISLSEILQTKICYANFCSASKIGSAASSGKPKVKLLDSQDLINYQKLEERMRSKNLHSKFLRSKNFLSKTLIQNKIGEAFFNSLNNHNPTYLQNKGSSQFLRNVVNNNSFYKYKVSNKLDKNNLSKNLATQSVKSKLVQKLSNTVLTKDEKLKDFWGANQFLSYQSVVFSDLFIDLHPPKSFSNFNSIKYSDSLQHPIGSMVCQIYSGIFTRQISKNLLIVGAQGMEKSLLIQALAGETEFPLITDNAYRYSMVQQGVAVGIKLLRDVFDALALHTPCLFLLEDIHAIGERRPFLISDDQIHGADLLKNEFAKTGLDERNQIIYQLSKHIVSHFKKPYKGDFALTIPTNQFCFEYLGNNKKGSSNQNTKQNLLNSSFISYVKNQNSQKEQNNNNFEKFITNNNNQKTKSAIFPSYLQLPSNQLLAPPATSPFSVLVLKESRDTKNSAVVPVKEMPWSGLPGEQYSLINKASYSVRVKVALLADMAISNLSVKLDMITDLLVIIDSVKGNRGFAVFATTHIPSILDPALRRPGRLDETILVPKSSVNMLCRWEVFKSQFSLYNVGTQNSGFSRSITIDFSSFAYANQNLVKQNFVQNKLNLFAQFNSTSFITKNIQSGQNSTRLKSNNLDSHNRVKFSSKPKISLLLSEKSNLLKNISLARKKQSNQDNLSKNKKQKNNLATKSYKNLVSRSYFVVSEKLICSLFNSDPKIWKANFCSVFDSQNLHGNNNNNNLQDSTLYLLNSLKDNNSIYPILYSPKNSEVKICSAPKLFKDYFVNFMAGKIGEMFLSTAYYNTNSFFNISPQKNLTTQSAYGIDKTWHHISDFATQLIQKRYLYNQKLFSLSNIFFTNNSSFKEPPGPPSSNVLLPARRSFNYQRNFYSQQIKRSNNLNIHEKIQLHQQQRLVKRLYGYPVQEFFFTKENNNNLTTGTSFANAPLVLGKHELILEKPSSSTWFYQKKILSRHKNYLTNQWWNAQLPEHNAETTFLSDIDWRYSFIDSGIQSLSSGKNSLNLGNKKQNFEKSKTQDLFIDFPDSVQYYNPRNRRWVLANNANSLNNNTDQIKNFGNIFDFSEFSQEIYSHFLFDAYVKAYNILNQNREILDYYASKKLTSACVSSYLNYL